MIKPIHRKLKKGQESELLMHGHHIHLLAPYLAKIICHLSLS